jgi:hypothetical protein
MLDREEQLEATLNALDGLEEAYQEALTKYFDAEAEYRIAKADAFLKSEGTEKARDAQAIKETQKLLRERNKAEAVKEFMKAKIKDAQDAVSARQSLLNSSLKTSTAFGR